MTRAAPEDMRGRVNSTVILAATALAALSPLAAGLLVEHVSGQSALLAFAVVMAVAAVLCTALPGLRAAEAAEAAQSAPLADTDPAPG
jgi:MFS family permease